jgi:hypothetical protein
MSGGCALRADRRLPSGYPSGARNDDESLVALFRALADRVEADGSYRVFVQCSWQTTTIIAARSATEFKVTFGTPVPGNTSFDWLVVR